MKELWSPIPGFEGYDVSNLGNVRSWRMHRGVAGPRLLRTSPDNRGYMCTALYGPGGRKPVKVHWLVAAAFLGPRPDGLVIRHLDGNCANNRAGNLVYGTPEENIADSVRHRTHCKQGHAFSAENTFVRPNGSRGCRACRNESVRRTRQKQKQRSA